MKKLVMVCMKTATLCIMVSLCAVTAYADTNLSATFSAAAIEKAAQKEVLKAELGAIQEEMAQNKLNGVDDPYLNARAQDFREELGLKGIQFVNRDMTPTLDEGGESCTSATQIPGFPFFDSGYTCDNADDDNTDCANSNGPDVFYWFTPAANVTVRLTTCLPGTDFDTVLKIRDSAGNIVACNDDWFAGDACLLPTGQHWRSTIDCVELLANERYCIIVDGFGWTEDSDNYPIRCGNYQLLIEECGCALCPIEGRREGESVCHDGYIDTFNSGCNNVLENGNPHPAYQRIFCGETICGTGGAYPFTLPDGTVTTHRDTDWFLISITEPTLLRWCVTAEFLPLSFIIDVTNGCEAFSIVADGEGVNCEEHCIEACVSPGFYALWIGTNNPNDPCGSEYVATVECLPCDPPPPCLPEPGFVQLNPSAMPLPYYECLFICPDVATLVCVGPGLSYEEQPVVSYFEGCSPLNSACDVECPPAIASHGGWYYDASTGSWYIRVFAAPGSAPGCICFCLDDILPVELTSFDAIPGDGEIALNWITASETDNDHFDIERDGMVVGRIEAINSASGSSYNWTETGLTNGREYNYTLISVDINGNRDNLSTASATPSMSSATITEYALHQNYPNPFNPETNITFDLVESGAVTVNVYNAIGQTVATLVNSSMAAGRHTVNFDAASLPSGLYFYRMEAGEFSAIKKMILMK